MKAVIIGNNSIIGNKLKTLLLKKGHTVLTAGYSGNFDIFCDLRIENDFAYLKDEADVLIHCASLFENNTLEGYKKNLQVNTQGVIETVKLATALKVQQYIYLSSIFVYDENENEYRDDAYAVTKRFGEKLSEILCVQNKIDYTAVRISQIYDFEGKEKGHQAFLYSLIDQIKSGKDITLYGSQDPIRNYLAIDDAAESICRIAENKVYGIWPLVALENYKITEIVQMLNQILKKDAKVFFDAEKENIKTIYIPKNALTIYEKINYKPLVSLESGLRNIIEFKGEENV